MNFKVFIYHLDKFIGKLSCLLGFHEYTKVPVLANLDTYWLQGGYECSRCGKHKISFEEAQRLVKFAYERGKDRSTTEFVAYGAGIKKVVDLYGKDQVRKMVDEI